MPNDCYESLQAGKTPCKKTSHRKFSMLLVSLNGFQIYFGSYAKFSGNNEKGNERRRKRRGSRDRGEWGKGRRGEGRGGGGKGRGVETCLTEVNKLDLQEECQRRKACAIWCYFYPSYLAAALSRIDRQRYDSETRLRHPGFFFFLRWYVVLISWAYSSYPHAWCSPKPTGGFTHLLFLFGGHIKCKPSSSFFSWEQPSFITFLFSSYNESFAKSIAFIPVLRAFVSYSWFFSKNVVIFQEEWHTRYRERGSLKLR